ncbi:uncharacterized protein O3C94_016485 [Discoglossus pictus]
MSEKIWNQTTMIKMITGEHNSDFDDVAIYFSEEEWGCLNKEQKELYKEVMMENYQTLRSLGRVKWKPVIISMIEKAEEPYVRGQQDLKKNGPSNNHTSIHYWSVDIGMTAGDQGSIVLNNTFVNHLVKYSQSQGESGLLDLQPSTQIESVSLRNSGIYMKNHITKELQINSGNCRKRREGFNSFNSQPISHKKIDMEKKQFTCSNCGKCFAKKSQLVQHQLIHEGNKPFACSDCGKCFIHKSFLVVHQITHTEDKPFACCECGKSFGRKNSLVDHQRIHTGEKPFACSECGKCFTSNAILVKHLVVHTGKKPFPCSECGKSFFRRAQLVTHRHFICPQCGTCFSQKSHLVTHQNIHTGGKTTSGT